MYVCMYVQLGYNQSDFDTCSTLADESRIYLILYVVNVLLAGTDKAEIEKLKQKLHENFLMKELGDNRHILGMTIEQNWKTRTL